MEKPLRDGLTSAIISVGMGLQIASGESEDHNHPDNLVPVPWEVRAPIMENVAQAVAAPALEDDYIPPQTTRIEWNAPVGPPQMCDGEEIFCSPVLDDEYCLPPQTMQVQWNAPRRVHYRLY